MENHALKSKLHCYPWKGQQNLLIPQHWLKLLWVCPMHAALQWAKSQTYSWYSNASHHILIAAKEQDRPHALCLSSRFTQLMHFMSRFYYSWNTIRGIWASVLDFSTNTSIQNFHSLISDACTEIARLECLEGLNFSNYLLFSIKSIPNMPEASVPSWIHLINTKYFKHVLFPVSTASVPIHASSVSKFCRYKAYAEKSCEHFIKHHAF